MKKSFISIYLYQTFVFKVDLEQPLTVKAIVTKGSGNARANYVMKYVVKYSNTTSSWITLNGTSKVSHTCSTSTFSFTSNMSLQYKQYIYIYI